MIIYSYDKTIRHIHHIVGHIELKILSLKMKVSVDTRYGMAHQHITLYYNICLARAEDKVTIECIDAGMATDILFLLKRIHTRYSHRTVYDIIPIVLLH